MSADANLSTVQSIYQAFGAGDVPAILDLVTDDVDWGSDAATGGAPWHGPKQGKEGVASFFEAIGGALDVSQFDVVTMAATDDEVLSFVRFGFTPRAGGEKTSMHLHHYWHLTDGKVDYYRGSEDTALLARALGS